VAEGGRRPQPIHGQPDAVLSELHLKSLPKNTKFHKILVKKGSATPTYSRSARCRFFGASSQKFVEKHKVSQGISKESPCENWLKYLKKLLKKIFPFTKDYFIYKIYFKNFVEGRWIFNSI